MWLQGLRLDYLERGANVSMYTTNIDTEPSGPFSGKLVVSMRTFPPGDVATAIQVLPLPREVNSATRGVNLVDRRANSPTRAATSATSGVYMNEFSSSRNKRLAWKGLVAPARA